MWEIKLAETTEEREQVFRLRYDVYVEEMGRNLLYADHKHKRLEEALDGSAKIFAAYQDGQAIGTIRNNLAVNSNLEYYPEIYKMQETVGNAHPYYTSISTKLMIRREFRASNLFLDLFQALYKHLLVERVKFDFGDCDFPVTVFFQRLGYQVIGKVEHPEYGEGNILMLEIFNLEHLEKTHSPLRRICQNFFDGSY